MNKKPVKSLKPVCKQNAETKQVCEKPKPVCKPECEETKPECEEKNRYVNLPAKTRKNM